MKINVETTSPVQRKLTIEVPPERVQRELEKAYVQLGRRVKLKGFRPGHIPRGVLERNFKAEVESEVAEKLVNATFVEAATAEGVLPVASPSVSLDGALVPGASFRYSATVEVKPTLAPKDYRGLAVTRRAPVVGEAEVQAELVKLQESYAQLVPVEGRDVAEEGDYALIDHQGTIDGQPFEGGQAEGVTVRAAQGKVEEGFLPALVGKKVGETAEFDEPFAADHRNEALRGKMAHMAVSLKGLKVKHLAPLDDQLARQVGIEGIDTLEALKARIQADLGKREAKKVESEVKDALIKAALARNEFEVPPSLVERAIDNMLESTVERFARMGVDVAQLDLDVARLRGDLREQALLQVRGSLLLEAVAEAEKVEVTEEDLLAEVARVAEELGVPLQKAQQQMRGKDARAALMNRVREEKALALISQAAVIQA
ncbi:MAG: trigger factor [Anaeromyxobacter sp.]|nr:trigger factor [Anaeromyxobacter sp.]MBL0276297.1 trigger factor [Anaeromyxobacter sp.]